jgi:hypothetical protein
MGIPYSARFAPAASQPGLVEREGVINMGGTKKRMTPLGAAVRGAIAGTVGTLAMDLVLFARYRSGGGEGGFLDYELARGLAGWDEAGPPAQVGRRLVEGLFQTQLPDEAATLTTNVMHWSYGLGWAGAFGLVEGSFASQRIRDGLLLGATVWGSDYVVLPAAKLYKPFGEYESMVLAEDLAVHLVYGLVTAAVFKALSPRG